MIQQYGHIVTFMYIFAHSSILRRKRRGIYPKRDLKQDIADIDEENNELDESGDQQDSEHGSSQSLDEAEQKQMRDLNLESGIIKY